MKKSTIIVVAVVVLILVYFSFTFENRSFSINDSYTGFTYNYLVYTSAAADAQWAQVQTQYQRRFDLIPNLVNAVKGVMKQESAVFGAIADARTHYANAKSTDDKAKAASEVESTFARLLVVMENYPQLKSADNVLALQSQIEGTENRISIDRQRFNDDVRRYNLAVSSFPSFVTARIFGFNLRSYFQAAAGTDVAPTVNL